MQNQLSSPTPQMLKWQKKQQMGIVWILSSSVNYWRMHVALDNHDIISMKLYQLAVERTAEEEEEEEVTIPRVDNMEHFQGSHHFMPRTLDEF